MKKYELKNMYLGKIAKEHEEFAQNDTLKQTEVNEKNETLGNMHTDLAAELGGTPFGASGKKKDDASKTSMYSSTKTEPITVNESRNEDILITEIFVNNKEGVERTGKPEGRYVTIDMGRRSDQISDHAAIRVAESIGKYIKSMVDNENASRVLIIGLGNSDVTPDSLGPKVVSQINVTRHIMEFLDEGENALEVSAFSPGVLGITGIETYEIVKGIVERTQPHIIIAVDALSTLNASRISSSIQIANTGIVPGSGVGNHRLELSRKTMGIPVVALGVPLIVELLTFLNSFSEKGDNTRRIIESLPNDLMITPKSIDDIVDCSAELISKGINIALGVDSLYN